MLSVECYPSSRRHLAGCRGGVPPAHGHASMPQKSPTMKLSKLSEALHAPYENGSPDTEITTAMLRSKNPYLTFAHAIKLFYQPPQYAPGVHATAAVHPSAQIGPKAHIGPYVVIDENVVIGE